MAKYIEYSSEVRKKMKAGIDKVAQAVNATIGPKGRNVIIGKQYGGPVITNDGVSIAKEIELEDLFENLGADLIKQVAEKTNDTAGDGTTTSVVLTQSLISEGLKLVEAGLNPVCIRKGMEKAKNDITVRLVKSSEAVSSHKEISQVATISAESTEMGDLIADVMDTVGKDGVVTTETSQSVGISKEVVQGMSIESGFISPYMMTEDQKAELSNPAVFITDKRLTSSEDIVPILEALQKLGKKELFIIAEDVDNEALSILIVNKLRGALKIVAVKAPEFGDNRRNIVEDIAVLTGTQVVSEEKGMTLKSITPQMFGTADKVIAKKDTTSIVGGKGKIEARVKALRKQIEATQSNPYELENLKKRLAKLVSGVAVIRVGASTETETTYLKHKVEDAVSATKAALEEGIVVGGGVALLRAAKGLKVSGDSDFTAGYKVVVNACEAPIRQVVKNSGEADPSVVLNKILESKLKNYGYNAKNNTFENDMVKAGIIDPLKVTRTALENSVSVASLFLTTEAAIVEDKLKME